MILDLREATAGTGGAKGGSLGRLVRAGARVPAGFVVPLDAYRAAVAGLDLSAADARRRVETRPLPAGLHGEVARWLAARGDPPVAVRSSGSTEDTAAASGAGQHDSFLGVVGAGPVTAKVRSCWGSLWSPGAVAYRRARRLPADPAMAVVVQRHVDADVAGVLFTGDAARVEASWGLGESVVSGRVTPDSWTVSPTGVTRHTTGDKHTRIDRAPAGTVTRAVPTADRRRPCLDDAEVSRLVAAGREVARLFGAPVDVEWALADGEIWLLQARPITAAPPPAPAGGGAAARAGGAAVLAGVPGSAGIATGPARLIAGPGDFGRVTAGDVLVCRFTDPAWTPLFAVASAVVTEIGGVLSHAAIVAREHRIPAVLGAVGAMATLRDGQTVVVDGDAGTVHPERDR
ncbi:PEP/pyruvate-binding domain-containing protein [Jidongwangia harbinensis]|uniref:PEP/pyruvate-binding domain-containing protein n=1 Tax=Jidongwangia harbinensis TaxID=2878561 RepID=UPI001CD9F3C9|nr:PEP/pyruvate-binding domain-containing protein [Jidongwangia harbinensis]MCA2218206.1 pyruvate, phosphate dikinase [Jidongwangia harbinensis]